MNPNHYLAVAIEYLFAHRAELARRRRDRQDARVELDDRPGRRVARPAPLGGAGRLQVVRAGPRRRVGRLRRRGERRRVVPAVRRHRVDDRQGRHPAVPARVGDPRGHGQVARRSSTASSSSASATPPTSARMPRRRPRRRPPSASSTATRSRRPSSPASRSRRSCRTRRATTRRSAASRWRRPTPGSRRGRAARKTSTRSTPSRSAGPEHLAVVQEEAKRVVSDALASAG